MIESEHEYELCTELGGFCDIASAARQAGLVRAFGASFHAATGTIRRAIEERAFDVVMFQFNLVGRETVIGSSIASYRALLPVARANGVGVVVMKVLAGGELRHGASRLGFVSDSARGRDTAAGAVRYATMHPLIASSVVGMSCTEELVANIRAVEDVDDSMEHEFEDWTSRAEGMSRGQCTRCGECAGVCPEKIEIPKLFRIYDQQRLFGMDQTAQYKYHSLEVKAEACTNCGRCEAVCPEHFDVPALLAEAHDHLTKRQERV